ncbi:MAG: hypothetical protein HYZ14_07620 [Bacteroidetes bacterium]|nr:hypothetical protein [Bacteroidota bacterium]
MTIKTGHIFLPALLLLLLSSCFKKEQYPIEPVISDAQFVNMTDSAVVTFSFTDGDGDIGLNDAEMDPPFDSSSYYYYNLYLDYYEKDDANGWQQGLDLAGDPISFKYRIERIEVKGKQRGMKGTIDVALSDFQNPFSTQSDTIKFSIKLIDRALHESNVIETGEIIP